MNPNETMNILWMIVTYPLVKYPLMLVGIYFLAGGVFIRERDVGIVIKRFGLKNLQPGQIIALRGEAGYQADTLSPGLHFFYWRWQYSILKTPMLYVPQGELALVIANAGEAIPPGRILGRSVDCNHFQDARAFLANNGEKGRQLAVLTAGQYRINTALFTVITSWNAQEIGRAHV